MEEEEPKSWLSEATRDEYKKSIGNEDTDKINDKEAASTETQPSEAFQHGGESSPKSNILENSEALKNSSLQIPKESASVIQENVTNKPKPGILRPSLRGILTLNDDDTGTWEGQWGMDDSAFEPGGFLSPFLYTSKAEKEGYEVNKLRIPNLRFSGYFMMGSSVPGQPSTRHEEKDVLFQFSDSPELNEYVVKVVGSGKNQFGSFTLDGTYDATSGELHCYRTYVLKAGRKSTSGKKNSRTPSQLIRPKRPRTNSTQRQSISQNVKEAVSNIVPEHDIHMITRDRPGRVRRTPSHLIEDEDESGSPLATMKRILGNLISNDKEGWFIRPVDAEALGLINYHVIIKQPMDLGTVRERLENSVYISEEEVITDIRRTFNNAMTFNPVGHPVYRVAAQHLKLFEAELKRIVRQQTIKPKSAVKKKSVDKTIVSGKDKEKSSVKDKSSIKDKSSVGGAASSGRRKRPLPTNENVTGSKTLSAAKKSVKHNIFSSSDENEDAAAESGDSEQFEPKKRRSGKKKAKRESKSEGARDRDSEEMKMLRKQVEMMNKQIEMMQQMQQANMFSMMAMNNGHLNGQQTAPVTTKAAPKKRDIKPLSYQEKRQLGQDIHKLPGDMIQGVITIIQESGVPLGGDGDEVELDIEALDTPALKKLQKYVRKCLMKARSKKSMEDIENLVVG